MRTFAFKSRKLLTPLTLKEKIIKVLFQTPSQGILVNFFGYQLYTRKSKIYSNNPSLSPELLTQISTCNLDPDIVVSVNSSLTTQDINYKGYINYKEKRQDERRALGYRALIHEIRDAPRLASFVGGNPDPRCT